MKITIEITVEEARMLLQHEEKPEITDEIHEDFEETDIKPDPEPSPESDSKPQPKPLPSKKQQRNVRDPHPVEVKVDGKWRRFSSMTEAAKLIGCYPSQVSSALANGWMVRGYELRYAKEEQDEEDLPRGNGHE